MSSSIWISVKRLKENDVILKGLYKAEGFPIFVRDILSDWIEKQQWETAHDQIFLGNESLTVDLAFDFYQLVDKNLSILNKCKNAEDLLLIEKLRFGKPFVLVSKICKLLFNEKLLLIKTIENSVTSIESLLNMNYPMPWLYNFNNTLKNGFEIDYNSNCLLKNIDQMVHFPSDEIYECLKASINSTIVDLSTTVRSIGPSVKSYLSFIMSWNSSKQKSLSGEKFTIDTEYLAKKCCEILDISSNLYLLANKVVEILKNIGINITNDLRKLLEEISSIIRQIIERSLVIDINPQQVLKTQNKFNLSARLLVVPNVFNSFDGKVFVSLISEKTAKKIHHSGKMNAETCGELSNNISHFVTKDNKTTVDFRNITLKSINREERRCSESVLDAKLSLCLQTKARLFHLDFSISCLSCPVVVVVHGNQTCASEATIFWDNMFSKAERDPYDVPEVVSWAELSYALNIRWLMSIECDIFPENMAYLKLRFSNENDEEDFFSWKSFSRNDSLKLRSISLWDWFFSAMDLVKKFLKDIWKARIIHFILKKNVKYLLESTPVGSFIIRFSDSLVGSLSISYVENLEGKVVHLKPWSVKDLSVRSLTDRISDLSCLKNVLPLGNNILSLNEMINQASTKNLKFSYYDTDYVDTSLKVVICDKYALTTYDNSPCYKKDISLKY